MASPHPLLLPLAAGREIPVAPTEDDGLLASAIDHGMHGLLWTYVRDHAPGYSERARLAGFDAATRQRHERLRRTLAGVGDTLATIEVECAVVKGVGAEARWYGREGERPCTDVDILVDPAAIVRAAEIVGVLDPTHPLLEEVAALVHRDVMQSVNLRVDGVSVDLHFDLLKLGFPMRSRDDVWDRLEPLVLADGTRVRVPDSATSLVHFLVHANKDGFPRLLGYVDVARLLAADELDWSWFSTLVRREGLELIAAGALDTITRALAVPPAPVTYPRGVRTGVWRAVWPTRVTLLGGSGTDRSRRQEVVPFLVSGRFRDACRGAARVVLPPASALVARYPDLPGPYARRLVKGRARSWRERRASFRNRQRLPARVGSAGIPGDADTGSAALDPDLVVRLMRTRARERPLWIPVSGRSMGRSIPSGVQVRIEAWDEPRRGDVWAFCNGDGDIVVHRCRGSAGSVYRFQGDACVRADPPVRRARLIGRVVETAPPRHSVQWGRAAGAARRVPRVAVSRTVRVVRRLRTRAPR